MPRILENPGLERCPDFMSPAFENLVETISVARLLPVQDIARELADAWKVTNDHQKAAWAVQEQEDLEAQDNAEQLAEEERENLRVQQQQLEEAERREAKKKKPKIGDFDENKVVGDAIGRRPAAFAINKLESLDYVELWYFTPEGCAEASENQRAVAEEAYGLTKVDNFMALRPIAAFKASRNVIRDMDLTWRQMTMAKNALLQQMTKAKWPEKHVRALALFFLNLELHDQRLLPNGEHVLLIYQAKVRKDWHESLRHEEGFNIATINEVLVKAMADQLHEQLHTDSLRRSVILLLKVCFHLLTCQLFFVTFTPFLVLIKCYMLLSKLSTATSYDMCYG